MEGRENRQIGQLVKKIRMNRQWRHVKGNQIYAQRLHGIYKYSRYKS